MREKVQAHIENIALHHTVFDLPFAYMGAFLAAKGHPGWGTLLWITLAVTGARSAALAIDNFVDLKYDKVHPRFTKRPMVRGAVTKGEALLLIVMSLALCLYAVAKLPPVCLRLLPLAALPFVVYPFMKRLTGLCHAVLGVAIAMAPAGGWMAAGGQIDPPMLLLCSAVGIWIGAFDVIYGVQDEAFDRTHGLHSLATEVGAVQAVALARIGHFLCILCFAALGALLHLAFPYYIGVFLAAATLLYQHSIVDIRQFRWLTQRYFMCNGIVAVAMFLCTAASFYF